MSDTFQIKENEEYFVFPTKLYQDLMKEFKDRISDVTFLKESVFFYKIRFYLILVSFLILLVLLYFYLNR